MNIFFLSMDTYENAKFHCDKHVVKQILESAQMLCTVHWATGGSAPYKKAHLNHPCSIWARTNTANYLYLCKLGLALCKEYTHRYKKIHASQAVIQWCLENVPDIPKSEEITQPAQAMPDEYRNTSVVEAYRNYYIHEKAEIAKWKVRETPKWFR